MRFKKENWQPTIGDKYDIANFDGMILSGLRKWSQLLRSLIRFVV